MNSEIEWSLEMTDSDFVEVSEEYFSRQRIDLHIGCCLLAKVNPELKAETVGRGYLNWDAEPEPESYDYTRRPFDVALRALNGETEENPLVATEPLRSPIRDAREVNLSTRTFVKWALKQWPQCLKSAGMGPTRAI